MQLQEAHRQQQPMEISTVYNCQDIGFECELEKEQSGATQWIHAKTAGVRFDSSLEDEIEGAERRGCCIRNAHCDSESHRQEMGQVENNDRYLQQMGDVQTMSDELTDAKEQLRMASPGEREMREMLMRIGGDDPDERFKHGVPRQQDLTQQQPPTECPPQKQHVSPETSSQPLKLQSRKEPRQQQFHPEPGRQVKQDAPRQEPVHERQESRPNQEPQQTPRQKQRV